MRYPSGTYHSQSELYSRFPLASSFKNEEEEEKEDLHQFSLTPDVLSQEDPRLGALNI